MKEKIEWTTQLSQDVKNEIGHELLTHGMHVDDVIKFFNSKLIDIQDTPELQLTSYRIIRDNNSNPIMIAKKEQSE